MLLLKTQNYLYDPGHSSLLDLSSPFPLPPAFLAALPIVYLHCSFAMPSWDSASSTGRKTDSSLGRKTTPSFGRKTTPSIGRKTSSYLGPLNPAQAAFVRHRTDLVLGPYHHRHRHFRACLDALLLSRFGPDHPHCAGVSWKVSRMPFFLLYYQLNPYLHQ